jgi:hypothetical protein
VSARRQALRYIEFSSVVVGRCVAEDGRCVEIAPVMYRHRGRSDVCASVAI